MKRRDLIRHLEHQGCVMLREGANHDLRQPRRQEDVERSPTHRDQQRFGQEDL